jgi:lysophospholipase L1-like esterase
MKTSLLRILVVGSLLSLQMACVSLQPTRTNQKDIKSMENQELTYLALGDSYTIGEGVEESGRYPNITRSLLAKEAIFFSKPMIIAKTGWTTDELAKGIEAANIQENTYDMVTLLIGVNNQYRGRPVENYKEEFRSLLLDAITFAKGDPNRVAVISIPDWGITPFAKTKTTDQDKVSREIDAYNAAKKEIAEALKVYFIEITQEYRQIGAQPEMVVSDNLHPSSLVYEKWAKKLTETILSSMEFRK